MPRQYLDHASSSPLRPEVRDAMVRVLDGACWADPGRVHQEGAATRGLLEDAREKVAHLLGAAPRQVVFTSGGAEAVNSAVWGASRRCWGRPIVCSRIEHPSVRESSRRMAEMMATEVLDWDVSSTGRLSVARLEGVLRTAKERFGALPGLVNCQWANHEVGTVQPVAEVVEICRSHGVLVHVDACAALGHGSVDIGEMGADLVSVTAHKAGGPKGAGALVLRPGLRIDPLLVGGFQERGRRAGIENAAAIVGFGALAEALSDGDNGLIESETRRSASQTKQVLDAARCLPGVEVYGDPDGGLAHIASFGVEDVEAEGLVLALDQAGIAVHSGSACSAEALGPSEALEAMGVNANHSLRVSVGWSTTDADVTAFVEALPVAVGKLRALRA